MSWFLLRGNSPGLPENGSQALDPGELSRRTAPGALLFSEEIWAEALFFVTSRLSSVMPGSLGLGAPRFNLAKKKTSSLLLAWKEAVSWLCGMGERNQAFKA